jgi:hypothetical protein
MVSVGGGGARVAPLMLVLVALLLGPNRTGGPTGKRPN